MAGWFMRYFTTTPVLSSGALQQPLCDVSGNLKMALAASTASSVVTRAEVYPTGAVALIAGSGNVAAAAAAATLTGTASTTVYISGFEMTASGATAGLPVLLTATGLLGGTRTWIYTFPAGALIAATPLVFAFDPPLPASAVNTAIVVSCPSGGVGNTNAAMVAHGFYI